MNSGLGQFCFHLYQNLLRQLSADDLIAITKKNTRHLFQKYKKFNTINTLFPFTSSGIFHLTHQESPLMFTNGKGVLTIHDLNFLHKNHYEFKEQFKLKKIQDKINACKAVVFISEYTKSECERCLNFKNKITKVIYNGNPIENFPLPNNSKTGEKHYPFIFSIGIIQPKKNFEVLIKAMPYVASELKLIIAGDAKGAYFDYLKSLVIEYKLGERVIFIGKISEEQKIKLYDTCSLFAFPSIAEGFGLPLVEAMSRGCNIICSRLCSLPEIGKNLIEYFDDLEPKTIAEQINKQYHSPKHNAAELIEYSKKFSWKNAAQQYIELYKEIS